MPYIQQTFILTVVGSGWSRIVVLAGLLRDCFLLCPHLMEGAGQTLSGASLIKVPISFMGFPGGTSGKEPACQYRNVRDVSSIPGSGDSPKRRARQPTPIFLPEESPWTEEPVGLQSIGLQRLEHD